MSVLLEAAVNSGLMSSQKRRDSPTISERMSSFILTAKVQARRKLLLTIDAHSDGLKK
jgi:hypothetical protein